MGLWWNSDFGKKYNAVEYVLSNSEFTNHTRQPPGCIQLFLYPTLILLALGFVASLFGFGS